MLSEMLKRMNLVGVMDMEVCPLIADMVMLFHTSLLITVAQNMILLMFLKMGCLY